ncbi:FAD assembly factor SdhE [Pseudovibrio flavus]|uniref:FAD assembly factor SdhE n=1 Tax=Pseudovibrio flavus TaxID=2529854 RepID=UPI003528EF3C
MSEVDQNKNEVLENRRKRALFRCTHRGMKEMDILLGGYAEAHLPLMNETELSALEEFLTLHDQDLFAWLMGSKPVPSEHDTKLFRDILAYYKDA